MHGNDDPQVQEALSSSYGKLNSQQRKEPF